MRPLSVFVGLALVGTASWLVLFENRWPSWQEEVLMHSGDILTVRRSASMKRFSDTPGGPAGWSYQEGSVEIVPSRDRPAPPSRWQSSYRPLIIDLDHQGDRSEWLIVATFASCWEWTELGRPRLPYVEFRYRDGQWAQQPLSAKLVGRAANLLAPIELKKVPDQTVEMKRWRIDDPLIGKYGRVVSQWRGCD
jgi:hypothetical protein